MTYVCPVKNCRFNEVHNNNKSLNKNKVSEHKMKTWNIYPEQFAPNKFSSRGDITSAFSRYMRQFSRTANFLGEYFKGQAAGKLWISSAWPIILWCTHSGSTTLLSYNSRLVLSKLKFQSVCLLLILYFVVNNTYKFVIPTKCNIRLRNTCKSLWEGVKKYVSKTTLCCKKLLHYMIWVSSFL